MSRHHRPARRGIPPSRRLFPERMSCLSPGQSSYVIIGEVSDPAEYGRYPMGRDQSRCGDERYGRGGAGPVGERLRGSRKCCGDSGRTSRGDRARLMEDPDPRTPGVRGRTRWSRWSRTRSRTSTATAHLLLCWRWCVSPNLWPSETPGIRAATRHASGCSARSTGSPGNEAGISLPRAHDRPVAAPASRAATRLPVASMSRIRILSGGQHSCPRRSPRVRAPCYFPWPALG